MEMVVKTKKQTSKFQIPCVHKLLCTIFGHLQLTVGGTSLGLVLGGCPLIVLIDLCHILLRLSEVSSLLLRDGILVLLICGICQPVVVGISVSPSQGEITQHVSLHTF